MMPRDGARNGREIKATGVQFQEPSLDGHGNQKQFFSTNNSFCNKQQFQTKHTLNFKFNNLHFGLKKLRSKIGILK